MNADDVDVPDHGDPTGPAVDVESLPVQLVFVAGETEMPLRELHAMGPGYVFDLRLPVDRHVEIRANGQTIGRGDLVEIDGRVGVRVLTCNPSTTG